MPVCGSLTTLLEETRRRAKERGEEVWLKANWGISGSFHMNNDVSESYFLWLPAITLSPNSTDLTMENVIHVVSSSSYFGSIIGLSGEVRCSAQILASESALLLPKLQTAGETLYNMPVAYR